MAPYKKNKLQKMYVKLLLNNKKMVLCPHSDFYIQEFWGTIPLYLYLSLYKFHKKRKTTMIEKIRLLKI